MIFGDFDYRSHRFIFILNRIEGTRSFLKNDASEPDSQRMMGALGRFHAQSVCGVSADPEAIAKSLHWAQTVEQPNQGLVEKFITPDKNWKRSKEWLLQVVSAGLAPPEEKLPIQEVYATMLARKPDFAKLCLQIQYDTADKRLGWRGLRHTDCRADNFFHPPGSEEAGLLDFQMVLVACVAYDVAYNGMGSQPPEFWTPDESAWDGNLEHLAAGIDSGKGKQVR